MFDTLIEIKNKLHFDGFVVQTNIVQAIMLTIYYTSDLCFNALFKQKKYCSLINNTIKIFLVKYIILFVVFNSNNVYDKLPTLFI